jgi:hypothetical protein
MGGRQWVERFTYSAKLSKHQELSTVVPLILKLGAESLISLVRDQNGRVLKGNLPTAFRYLA